MQTLYDLYVFVNGWGLLTVSIHLLYSMLLSQLLLTISTVIVCLSAQIYLNHASGENRSPPQSGTNCIVRFMHPKAEPDKRRLVKAAVLFVFARLADCAVIKVFLLLLCCSCGCGAGLELYGTSKLSPVWSRGRTARNAVGANGMSWHCF